MESHRTIVTGPDGEAITEPEKDFIRRQAATLDEWAIEQGYDVDETRLALLMGDVEVDRLISRMLDHKATKAGVPDRELRSWFIATYTRMWPDATDRQVVRSSHAFVLRCAARAGLLRKRGAQ